MTWLFFISLRSLLFHFCLLENKKVHVKNLNSYRGKGGFERGVGRAEGEEGREEEEASQGMTFGN